MKGRLLFFLVIITLAACAPTDDNQAVETTIPVVLDEKTGLPLNPEFIPNGEFIVEGVINAVTVIPQDKPLFKIMTDTGQLFQINAQPVSEIFMADGTTIRAVDFKNGMIVRATVFQGDAGGLGGEPVLTSKNLTIISDGE